MEIIIKLIYAVFITQMWISSTPTIMLRKYLGLDEEAIYNSAIKNFFVELFNCALCTGFWIAIILLTLPLNNFIHAVGIASVSAILSELFFKTINND